MRKHDSVFSHTCGHPSRSIFSVFCGRPIHLMRPKTNGKRSQGFGIMVHTDVPIRPFWRAILPRLLRDPFKPGKRAAQSGCCLSIGTCWRMNHQDPAGW